MEGNQKPNKRHALDMAEPSTSGTGRRRSSSNSSLFSKLSFIRPSGSESPRSEHQKLPQLQIPTPNESNATATSSSPLGGRAMASAMQQVQQQKTRRRRGSLRKVALLGRGAQRDRKEKIEPSAFPSLEINQPAPASEDMSPDGQDTGLEMADTTSNGGTSNASISGLVLSRPSEQGEDTEDFPQHPQQFGVYPSTTDEEDTLQIPISSTRATTSDSYFSHTPNRRRRSFQKTRSPLGNPNATLPATVPGAGAAFDTSDHDYSDTVWWGWVILISTALIWIIGMGSCLDVWTWAWDVGATPYAPPELEDDPTLPITGYYPALIILTPVVGFVWLVASWVGMKYFRHATFGGD